MPNTWNKNDNCLIEESVWVKFFVIEFEKFDHFKSFNIEIKTAFV